MSADRPPTRIGTRGSALARAQAGAVAATLGGAELVTIRTADGDVGDKARFVRGVDRALVAGEVELAVHSAKDLPGELADGVVLACVPGREDPRDALVGSIGAVDEIGAGARIGTSSLRRRSQLLALQPDCEVAPLRGNVDTRLAKLEAGEYDAIVLAAAGIHRLGRSGEISFCFSLEEMTPAPGQGTLVIEARDGDEESATVAGRIADSGALTELTAERAATRALGATCDTPVGVCARFEGDELTVYGYAGLPDGSDWVRDVVRGDPEQPAILGDALAERMLLTGAGELLERAAAEASA